MTTPLETVREAVIKANPTDPRWNVVLADEEKVRLADVLLAVDSKASEGLSGLHPENQGDAYTERCFQLFNGVLAVYNLRQDDLEKQSPETIEFLASLLTKVM